MSRKEIARVLAEMSRDMEIARLHRNQNTRKIYHQTDPEAWERLKVVLAYEEPAEVE